MSLVSFTPSIQSHTHSQQTYSCLLCGQTKDVHMGHRGHRWVPASPDLAAARLRVIAAMPAANYRLGLPLDKCGVYGGVDFFARGWRVAEELLGAPGTETYTDGVRASLNVVTCAIGHYFNLADTARQNHRNPAQDEYTDKVSVLLTMERMIRKLLSNPQKGN